MNNDLCKCGHSQLMHQNGAGGPCGTVISTGKYYGFCECRDYVQDNLIYLERMADNER